MSEKYVPADLRRLVTQRAKDCCEYCRTQARFSADPLTIDHIIPYSLGGPTTAENLALSCYGCNQHKSTRTSALDPATGLEAPLFHPRQQTWTEHFVWDENFTLILGLTPSGRATVSALHLNRSSLVNQRHVLHAMNQHPPAEQEENIINETG